MKKRKINGFTLIEVAIAVVLIVIVGTSAIAALRVGMKTMGGTQTSAIASAAIREFREFTFKHSIEEIDALHNTTSTAVLGDGNAMPGTDGMTLHLTVVPVDDYTPSVTVAAEDSRTRVVTIIATLDSVELMEAVWLVAEH
ncbi:MAG: prepilin-type N-terminal cleavage/methylation domain-containing protein [Planctomycetes bacterium]|nr:prepilin-type N-terminal cleavage/methylation domain-containing protein [Planctomycetota bacterium]MCP4770347.1 prepilin-type N-terminal cleavage/methylation domain-containing protein [Planctomycetota bacterium]MCP4861903.1 prepilin-type N-terminal cleavage/methylation domain-containing protein [Planctomycetota bacterium]